MEYKTPRYRVGADKTKLGWTVYDWPDNGSCASFPTEQQADVYAAELNLKEAKFREAQRQQYNPEGK